MTRRSLAAALALVASLATSRPAYADAPTAADKAHAKEAYDRGVEAHKRGDMQRAAEEFAKADALAPSHVALQAALDAAVEADDPVLGAELIERAAREPATGSLAASLEAARAKLGGRAGRVRVLCPSGAKCLAKLDDRFVDVDKAVWAKAGRHTIVIQVDGEAQTKLVDLRADQMLDVVPASKAAATPPGPSPSPPPPVPEPRPSGATGERPAATPHRDVLKSGLPPIFFYAGVGVTLLSGGALAYMAIHTGNKHDEFTNAGCDRAPFAGCQDLKDEGEGAQIATNALIPVTAVLGVATAVLGIAFTDWKGPVVAVTPGGGSVALARRF